MRTKIRIGGGQFKNLIKYFIVVTLVIMVIIGALVGTSFSLFSYNAPGRKENTIITGNQIKGITITELVAKSNPESLSYNNATTSQKLEMWTHSHPATSQTGALIDYRYIGKNPNNYIEFNDEVWRIIGVFTVDNGTGNLEQRIKIIRQDSIGEYSWDNKPNGTGSSTNSGGSNEWSDSTLQVVLNSGPYYNHTTGTCPYGTNGATKSCDFTTTGLTKKAKTQIADSVFYLGGSISNSSTEGLTSQFYSYERGTNVYSGRSKKWTGKIGLMYVSDYGYATSGGTTTNREGCLAKRLYSWNDSSVSDCKNNNWLFTSVEQWTINPQSSDNNYVLYISYNGGIGHFQGLNYARLPNEVRPVVYLKNDIKLTGTGSSSDPYKIV